MEQKVAIDVEKQTPCGITCKTTMSIHILKVDHRLQPICYHQPLIKITIDIDAISERDVCIIHGNTLLSSSALEHIKCKLKIQDADLTFQVILK